MNFDGTASLVNGTDTIYTSTRVDFACRFRSTTTSSVISRTLFSKYLASAGKRSFAFTFVAKKATIYISADGNANSAFELATTDLFDLEWHEIIGKWEAGETVGTFSGTIDGIPFSVASTGYNSVNLPTDVQNKVAEGLFANFLGEIDYVRFGNSIFKGSSCWGTLVQNTGTAGGDGTVTNAVLANFWQRSDTATAHNFLNGFYLYENDTAGEEIRHPIQLGIADIPSGYTLSGYYPPLVFGNMESGFKVPYNAIVAVADTEGKLYDGTTPKEIKFSDLVTGGFGNKIKYVGTVAEGFRKFCVKK